LSNVAFVESGDTIKPDAMVNDAIVVHRDVVVHDRGLAMNGTRLVRGQVIVRRATIAEAIVGKINVVVVREPELKTYADRERVVIEAATCHPVRRRR
jgi:hypothetical protein